MKGFDAEFRDLDHYIRVITDRIWEGRRIDDIRLYYAADCAVETPSGVTIAPFRDALALVTPNAIERGAETARSEMTPQAQPAAR